MSAPTRKLVHPKAVTPKPKMVQCSHCSGIYDLNKVHNCRRNK